jgi:hypothetical protein
MSKLHKNYTVIYHDNIKTVIRYITIKDTSDQKKNINTILKIASQKTINKLVINLINQLE